MKKLLLIIALFMVGLTLKAAEPTVKFYLEDGNSKEYRIEDVTEMSFIKSDILYTMKVFLHDTSYTYLNTNIASLEFIDSTKIKINLPVTVKYIKIKDIDSIIFIPDLCSEITIDNQTWSCKNLDIDHYRNGDPVPEVTDSTQWSKLTTGAWCYYDNDPEKGKVYGKLYNWYAVTDPRGLAPEGWHIPNQTECWALYPALGTDAMVGGKLKSTGTYQVGDGLWKTPNSGATNESGFSALPGGSRYSNGKFMHIGENAFWWDNDDSGDGISVNNISPELESWFFDKISGQSVRCIKGERKFPVIISITPKTGFFEDEVTLNGTGFGETRNNSFVKFDKSNLQESEYLSWSDTKIKIAVSKSSSIGKVMLFVKVNGEKSNEVEFTVRQNVPGDCKYMPIGYQVWTCKNLNVDHYRNGDSIPQVTDSTEWDNLTTGAWCYFKNDSANGAIYGKLYNWFAVNDPRGLAPIGWHIPKDAEWKTLEQYLGMVKSQADSVGYRGTNQGLQLKEAGTEYWRSPNNGATDELGFSALPSSYRGNLGAFYILGKDCYWWSTSSKDPTNATFRSLNYYYNGIYRNANNKKYGFSVRCIQGEARVLTIKTVIPNKAYIRHTITLNGTEFGNSQGNSFVSFNSIKPEQSDYITWNDNKITLLVPKMATTGKISVTVGDDISNQVDFTVKQIEPNDCEPLTIGKQIWSCKNLDVSTYRNGDTIPQVTDSLTWSKLTTGAWCYYNNDPAMGAIYGKLYNWFAENDPRGLAPEGWHIPSDDEWTILANSLGGENIAADKLKTTGTYENGNGLWLTTNNSATNESGFSALPGGNCIGNYTNIGYMGHWWSSTNISYSLAWYRTILTGSSKLYRTDAPKYFGLSVRCIKD
jgi:uncharacterized protein (TIGR02145 family)